MHRFFGEPPTYPTQLSVNVIDVNAITEDHFHLLKRLFAQLNQENQSPVLIDADRVYQVIMPVIDADNKDIINIPAYINKKVKFTETFTLSSLIINPTALDAATKNILLSIIEHRLQMSTNSKGIVRNDILDTNSCILTSVHSSSMKNFVFVSFTNNIILYERKRQPGVYRLAISDKKLGYGSSASVYLSKISMSFDLSKNILNTKHKLPDKYRVIKMFDPKNSLISRYHTNGEFEQQAAALFAPHLRMKKLACSRPHTLDALISSYVDGITLEDFLERHLFKSDRDRVELCLAIAIEVRKIKELGGVHRDLKPQNIMVKRDNNGKLCATIIDFGFATSSLKRDKAPCGTHYFIAPEVAQEQGAEYASDIYSLCRIFEEIFSRYPSWSSNNYMRHYTDPFTYDRFYEKRHDHADRKKYASNINGLLDCMRLKNPNYRITIESVISNLNNMLNSTDMKNSTSRNIHFIRRIFK